MKGEDNPNFKGWRSKKPFLYAREFKRRNPEKVRAHRLVAAAIRSGLLVRPEFCDSCLRKRRIDAHHEDYAQPLAVEWLCRTCHVSRDKMRISRERQPYFTLEEGARFCRFDTAENPKEAFRRWLHRHAVPIRKRGKVLLIERRILEGILAGR